MKQLECLTICIYCWMYLWCIWVVCVCLWSNSDGFCSKQSSGNKFFVDSEVGFSLVRLIFVRIFSRTGPSSPVLRRTLQLEQLEVAAHGAESSCACGSFCVVPLQSCPLSPAQLGLHISTADCVRRGWMWLQTSAAAGCACPCSSLLLVQEHGHCWQLLSQAGPAVWELLQILLQGLRVLPGESSVCATAVSHTQRNVTCPRDATGCYSVSPVPNVCDFCSTVLKLLNWFHLRY